MHIGMSLPWLIVLLYVKTCQVELDKVASLVSRWIGFLDHHSGAAKAQKDQFGPSFLHRVYAKMDSEKAFF